MWKIKNKEAVSPVIGVILMVAITVVLAAVLYVCVSGMMGTTPVSPPTLTASCTANNQAGNITKWYVGSGTAKVSDITWQLIDNAGGVHSLAIQTTSELDVTENSLRIYVNQTGTDISLLDGGDTFTISSNGEGYFTVKALSGGSVYWTSGSTHF